MLNILHGAHRLALFFVLAMTVGSCQAKPSGGSAAADNAMADTVAVADVMRVGAERTELYLDKLKGKRIALLSNHTGMVGDEHTLDLMLRNGLDVTTIFSPEHGFRGNADAGEHVKSSVDSATGIPIA